MWQEFKVFISRGHVLDLAIAVILGAAFGSIVTSLVDDIIMPTIGILVGGLNFESLVLSIGDIELKYGAFMQRIVNFLIIAASIFLFIRLINHFKTKREELVEEDGQDEEIEKDEQIELLKEIRDLLKVQK